MKNGLIKENGCDKWYVNDKLHRLDGPAIESQDGLNSWYVHGKYVGEEISIFVTNRKTGEKVKETEYILNGVSVKKAMFLSMVLEKSLQIELEQKGSNKKSIKI